MLNEYQQRKNERFFTQFPHCRQPAVLRATVTAMTKLSDFDGVQERVAAAGLPHD